LEYILHQSISELVDSGKELPDNFWDFSISDLDNFELFCEKANQKIQSLLPKEIDERKRKLFNLIFETDGEISVKELAEKIVWNERQINRYFNKQLGISLKYYCKILRFQASLHHIKDGNLFLSSILPTNLISSKKSKNSPAFLPKNCSKIKTTVFTIFGLSHPITLQHKI
jgi:AraC-like DNA-binding protein